MEWFDDPGEDQIEAIARLMHLPAELLGLSIGGGWSRCTVTLETPETSDSLRGDALWFCAGEPVQVLLRVERHWFDVAQARIGWSGQLPQLYPVDLVRRERRDDVEEDLAWLERETLGAAKRSQERFAFCRFCRTIAAPEQLFRADPPVCHGCGSRYFGAVY
ncbi:MAG TPA: hypothetical protein VIH37_10430 [Candidatus Limnocylindrales bacterium]